MLLSAFRVLDLTDERGHLAGALFAALGAEVIAVEPPGGSPARRIGPFVGDHVDPECSLTHWAYNRGKKSIVLDLDDPNDQERLRVLADGADVLIESDDPGTMSRRGLGYDDLAVRNPSLVYTSISAFGQDGPKAGFAYSDLTLIAAGGQLILNGDDDRPPIRVGIDQAFLHASAEAAGGALLALYERQHSGRGQHVDISAQTAVMQCTQSFCLAYPLQSTESGRKAGGAKYGAIDVKLVYACKDGHVSLTLLFGAAIGPFTRRLMEWIYDEGGCDEATRDKDWIEYGMLLHTGEEPVHEWQRVTKVVTDFVATRTKAELFEAALARKLLIAPFATVADVVASPQLEARDFWEHVEHPGAGITVKYPGAFARFCGTPLAALGAAPSIGAHTDAVLGEPKRAPALPARVTSDGTKLPLHGLKVVDLMWAMAGPAYSRVLADFGATVVRIESERSIDVARTIQPFINDEPLPENSGLFANMNAGKLGMTLDLKRPEAREVFCDLVRWADVLVESFSPKAMRSWGLGYEQLRELNPRLIMVSSCLMGQTGPLTAYAGFGTAAAAICGYSNIVGWPDRDPSGPFSAYTDYVSPRFTLIALLAALEHRRATGEGQYIDFSQAEASMQFMVPLVLDYTVNQRVFERRANDDDRFYPHGVYPVVGKDRWVAIACTNDDHWHALCDEMGRTDLARDSRLQSVEGRRACSDVEAAIVAWTSEHDALDVQARLQARGVPCHEVANSTQSFADPQLQHRGHFVHTEHSLHGKFWVEAPRIQLSRTPGVVHRAGPMIGEHLFEVLSDHLGYDDDKVADVIATGALM